MNPNFQGTREYHLLLVYFYEMQVTSLDSRITVLGRNPSSNIPIECQAVSREHATFLRVPGLVADKHEFRIIDGGPGRKRSKNGIAINGHKTCLHRLNHGDIISFGPSVRGLYLNVELSPDNFNRYIAVLNAAEDITPETRDKILLMTRVFDKVMPHLSAATELEDPTPIS